MLTCPMPSSRDSTASNDGDAFIHSSSRPGQNPPLVIVSERGRHSQESRRIVRAQAARASAAQSRETRARNRGGRLRDSPTSPSEGSTPRQPGIARHVQPQLQPQPQPQRTPQAQFQAHSQPQPPPPPPQPQPQHPPQPPPLSRAQSHQHVDQHQQRDSEQQSFHNGMQSSTEEDGAVGTLKPLVHWITHVLKFTAASLSAAAAALVPGDERFGSLTRNGDGSALEEITIPGGLFSSKHLPIALPRGFAALQTRISISSQSLHLLSRSACFDYHSPGVRHRLNKLLFDIVMTTVTSNTSLLADSQPTHPIEESLRIASACLAIQSCQKTEGCEFAHGSMYNSGFEAAWQEAVEMDQEALKDSNSAEAALWAVFIISVTCGSAAFFSQLILGLLSDLRLASWADVRKVLINFNYPVTMMDHSCKEFYHRLLSGGVAEGA